MLVDCSTVPKDNPLFALGTEENLQDKQEVKTQGTRSQKSPLQTRVSNTQVSHFNSNKVNFNRSNETLRLKEKKKRNKVLLDSQI
jgi:hypothetical protein